MLFFDIELFKDFFVVGFMNEKEVYRAYTLKDLPKIGTLATTRQLVGFNSTNYDLPILEAALNGASIKELNNLSLAIINGERVWPRNQYNHIDLMQIAPGLKISLKLYAGRMHFPTMREIKFDKTPPIDIITEYNRNDLLVTKALYEKIKAQIDLRAQMTYKTSMVSKSDAQIAEYVFRELIPHFKIPSIPIGTLYTYNRPDWLKPFGAVDTASFEVGESGAVLLPEELKKSITIGDKPYQMGIGGLHSKESNIDYEDVTDFDVTSFYPNIIMKLNLYPEGLGPSFLTHYKKIINERVAAKRSGDKVRNETLKIVINGSFGKLGSKYSCLYSPQLLIQVTITGQLVILNLIDYLTQNDCEVISANTDGIVVKGDAQHLIDNFALHTGFEFESTHYKRYFGRDVNNYVAIKDDNTVKTKGTFSPASLIKNPDNAIIGEAVIQELLNGTGEAHIMSSEDITKFLQVRSVTGGAVFEGNYLGKVVRYYHSTTSTSSLQYEKNGNKVPKSDGCRPLMDLGDFPPDLDRQWYLNEFKACLNPKLKKPTVKKSKKEVASP